MRSDNENGYARRVNGITVSGGGDIVVNGETIKAQGNDIGDLAQVSAGMANLRRRGGAFALDDKSGNVLLNGANTGVRASDFAGGIDAKGLNALHEGYVRNSGDKIVFGRQAAETQGMGNLVRWDPAAAKMSIAGVDVPYLYITDDGNAMVSDRVMSEILGEVRRRLGVSAAGEISDNVYDKYKNRINDAVRSVTNRKEWSYDPAKDPVYAAYARLYGENAERAYNRAMGGGGLYSAPNSYQYYQALAGYGDAMQGLSAMIPQTAQQSYERYDDEQSRNLAALKALEAERGAEYDMRSQANEAQLSRLRADDAENYRRRQDVEYGYPMLAQELARSVNDTHISGNDVRLSDNDVRRSDMETDMYGQMLDVDDKIKNAELDYKQVSTLVMRLRAAQQRAAIYNGGMFMKEDMDALGIPQDMEKYPDSGGYPYPWDHDINEKLAQWYRYTLPVMYGVY